MVLHIRLVREDLSGARHTSRASNDEMAPTAVKRSKERACESERETRRKALRHGGGWLV